MNLHRSVLALAILLSTASTAACGGSSAPTATTSPTSATSDGAAPSAPIATVWRSRCSQCHTPVEPKTRDRAQLQAALSRHHNRTHLTDAQWDEMIDFLAR